MRLIDADEVARALDEALKELTDTMDALRKQLLVCFAKQILSDAPIIEAIPIEWIEKYNNENWFDAGTQYNAVTCMLDQWREEHESKDM